MRVTLLSGPVDPVKSIWLVWEQSRCDDSIGKMEDRYARLISGDDQPESDFPAGNEHPKDRFRTLLRMGVPIMEFLHFTFLLEDMHVSFREQLVRHKIGTRVGPQVSFDDIPGLADSTFWSQTSRVRDLGKFAENGSYYTPKSISDNPEALEFYRGFLGSVQFAYNKLRTEFGCLPEDAREVIPVAMTHRMAWHVNAMTLKRICADRSCWIAQSGYWHPVVRGVISELKVVDSIFSVLATPPCIDKKTDKYHSCPFSHENSRRLPGNNDPGIPCSLWSHHESSVDSVDSDEDERRLWLMEDEYRELWHRDPKTGDSLG